MRQVLTKLGNNATGARARESLAAPRAATAILVAVAALLAACGGGGDDDDTSAETQGVFAPEESEETEEAEGTIEPTTFTVDDVPVRYAGFVYELGDGELGPSEDFEGNPDPSMGRVTIETQIENLDSDTARPRPELHFEREGAALDVGDFSLSELPDVPGEAKSNGTIVADDLPTDFTLEGVVLVFGSDAVHSSKVPLDGNAPVQSANPLPITPGEPGKVGEATVTITGGELRYDNVSDHKQYDADKARLIIEYEMTASAAINDRAGSTYADAPGSDIQLGLPDGTRAAPEAISGTDRSVRLEPSETKSGLQIAFNVDSDLRGSFELAVKGAYGTDHFDEVAGFAPFEINDSVQVTDPSEEAETAD